MMNLLKLQVIDGCGFDHFMPRNQLQNLVTSYATPWIDFTLNGNSTAKTQLDNVLKQTAAKELVMYESTCGN